MVTIRSARETGVQGHKAGRLPRGKRLQERYLTTTSTLTADRIAELLGDDATTLLEHRSQTIPAEDLHLPGPDFVDRVYSSTDRNNQTLRNLQSLFDHGRLGGTGYVSILPVDQG